jgi:PAS domain S-box-containing protein
MERKLRKSGLDVIGDVHWGTHFCIFYQTKQDLLDILLPFFTAGLENNEFCMWVVSAPPDLREARAAEKGIHNLDYYLKKGQLEIVPYNNWYCRNGELNVEKLFENWIQVMERAVSRGFDGLRATGDTAWLQKKDWGSFMEYERVINDSSLQRNAIYLCSYPLAHCGASDVVDVVNSHSFAIFRREGRWEMIETCRHKKTEQALRESEERFRVLTETAAFGICIVQGEHVRYVNPEAEKITGYSKEELSRMAFWELIHPDHRGFLQKTAAENKGSIAEREIMIMSKEGMEKWIIFSCGAVTIQGEELIIGTFRDHTDRKMSEEITRQQLYRSQRMEAIGKFAGGMAHEINNQLTVIQACLDLYAREKSFSYARSKISRAIEKTCELNRQLMLHSRQSARSSEPVDLNRSLRDMQKLFNPLLGEDVTVVYELSEDLWTINADAANMEQVIINLMLNARGAMPQGGAITVKTKNMVIGEEDHACRVACFSVSDTGTGMDENVISQIFKPFFTTKDAGKGTGLGLAIVHSIIKAHGGWIDVQSKPGEGSTFHVFLPAVGSVSSLPGEQVVACEEPHGDGERVLLVEDDPDVVTLTRRVLVENGYRVFMCRKVGDALELFDRYKGDFDLVVSDLVLPDGRGFVLADQLKKQKPEIKVLLVSGYSERLIGMSRIVQQEYPFLSKPYTAAELLREARRLICEQSESAPAMEAAPAVISEDENRECAELI